MSLDLSHIICIVIGVIGIACLVIAALRASKAPDQQIHNLDVRLLSLSQMQQAWKDQTEATQRTLLEQRKSDRDKQDEVNAVICDLLKDIARIGRKQYAVLTNNYCVLQDCSMRKPKIGNYRDAEFEELMEKVDRVSAERNNQI